MDIAIIDDEKEYALELTALCRQFGREHNIQMDFHAFTGGEIFLDAFEPEQYTLIFMDIYMDGISGIETARRMRRRDSRVLLIFLTASTEHMPDAFACHAYEYITKPLNPERVFRILTDALHTVLAPARYMTVRSGRRTLKVCLADIISVVSSGHYLELRLTTDETLRCRMTAGRFRELTEHDRRFILVNRGVILNIEHIRELTGNTCHMDDGTGHPIQIRDYSKIEQEIHEYIFERLRRRHRGYPAGGDRHV